MVFEFGKERDKIICPLMPQKCMFDPINIKNTSFKLEELERMYKITPEIYKKFIENIEFENGRVIFEKILENDWNLKLESEKILDYLGINNG